MVNPLAFYIQNLVNFNRTFNKRVERDKGKLSLPFSFSFDRIRRLSAILSE